MHLLALLAVATPLVGPQAVMVLEIDADSYDGLASAGLRRSAERTVARYLGLTVLPLDESLSRECGHKLECAATELRRTSTDLMLSVRLLSGPRRVAVTLSRVKDLAVVDQVQSETNADLELTLVRSVEELFERLGRKRGSTLTVLVEPSDAQVRLGDAVHLVNEELHLPPGSYTVVISKDGYREQVVAIDLTAERATTIGKVVLEPEGAVYEKWWFWTGIAVVLAAGVGAGIAFSRPDAYQLCFGCD